MRVPDASGAELEGLNVGYGVGKRELQGRGADKAAARAFPRVIAVVLGAHGGFSGGLGHLVIQLLAARMCCTGKSN